MDLVRIRQGFCEDLRRVWEGFGRTWGTIWKDLVRIRQGFGKDLGRIWGTIWKDLVRIW